MRIGIFSDSHGDTYALKRAISKMGKVDMLIHLGDFYMDAVHIENELKINIIYVKGNCDYSQDVDLEKIIEVDNKRLLITHGHKYNVKNSYNNLYYKAMEEKIDIALFGHTHHPEVIQKGNILLINPGSVSRPKNSVETCAVISIENGVIDPSLIELY